MTLPDAHLDFETRSVIDLKKAGVYRYAEDPTTDIWLFRYKIGNGPVKSWDRDDPPPDELIEHVQAGGKVIAHNAQFERIIWNCILRRWFHWIPPLQIEQMECTMARALVMNLPGDLDRLGDVLSLPQQKDSEGATIMRKYMRPRRIEPDGTIVWWDDIGDLHKLGAYCSQDVRTESAAANVLPPLPDGERWLWELDQRINDRGVYIDVPLVQRAIELVEYAQQEADRQMRILTKGYVKTVGQVGKIVEWLNWRGIIATKLRKGDQDMLITQALVIYDDTAKEVIELRRQASKTSTAKYKRIMQCVCCDGRARGLIQYAGASQTLRWAGRLVQPQNYPRVDAETESDYVAYTVNIVKDRRLSLDQVHDLLELVGAPRNAIGETQEGMATLAWLSKALRSTIIAAPGNKLVGGDFANIEGRVNAWLASEQWKLAAFAAYDAGTGPDLYKVAFWKSFGIPIEQVTKPQRQIGKVEELALGYQGGVGAFITMMQTYLIKLPKITAAVYETVPSVQWDAMASRFSHARDKLGLMERDWTAVKLIVTAWREAHPQIVQGWWDLQDAAIQAVDNPFVPVPVYGGRCRYMSDRNYLYLQGPSGDVICYAQPSVRRKVQESILYNGRWYTPEDFEDSERHTISWEWLVAAGYEVKKQVRYSVHFWALDDKNRWREHALYGGWQCENIVQFTSRCVLKHSMRKVEDGRYPIILTVHDELLSEVKLDYGSEADYRRIMMDTPHWLAGCPVSAATWEDTRYVK